MSNHLISEAYKRQLGGMARNAVMVLLADKASDDGTGIWASKQRMAEELGTSKQTVITTVKSLIADGLLVEVGQRKCPNGYTIEYAINVEALRALPLVNSHQSNDVTGKAVRPVKQHDATGKAALPKPSGTPRNKKQPHAMPANWEPSEFGPNTKSGKIVASWSEDERAEHFERFAAHHRKLGNQWDCWQAAWSTWVLNTQRFKTRDPPPQRGSSIASLLDDVRQVHGL